MFTETLEALELPGYRLLDIHEMPLGRLDALGFEYRWDGLRPGEDGGDHALLVWGLSSWVAFHVYHHCPEDEWAAYLPELETILGTFRALAPHPPLDFSPMHRAAAGVSGHRSRRRTGACAGPSRSSAAGGVTSRSMRRD